jgi:hypothetical protein
VSLKDIAGVKPHQGQGWFVEDKDRGMLLTDVIEVLTSGVHRCEVLHCEHGDEAELGRHGGTAVDLHKLAPQIAQLDRRMSGRLDVGPCHSIGCGGSGGCCSSSGSGW